jgi:hypothetical protein
MSIKMTNQTVSKQPAQIKTSTATGTNGLAVASFILSLIGLGIIGVILGIIAITQINKRGQAGKGLAIAGIVIGVFTGLISIMVLTSDSSSTTYQIPSTTNSTAKPAATQNNATKSPAAETKPESKPKPTPTETVSQKNAVRKAKSYLGFAGFSHDGLVAQLEYEQFSHADAVYGADKSGADWNEQAAKKAKSYMDLSSFSRGGLIDQLLYEKFTQAQAEYGVDAVGL